MSRSIFLVSAIVCLAASGVSSKPAAAFGMNPYAVCGMMCMSYQSTMFSPFMGTPWLPTAPGFNSYYQTGQMGDPRIAMAQALSWQGSQPMGYSYLPPMGLSAVNNYMTAAAYGI